MKKNQLEVSANCFTFAVSFIMKLIDLVAQVKHLHILHIYHHFHL